MSVVGDVEFLHDRRDGHADGCTSITIEYKVFTFVQSCLHQGSEKKCVIHSSFFTTEVTGDGLDVMIGIHEHGRQQLAVVTTERCINVDHRRWVVQEAVHQGLDHTRNGGDVLEHLRIILILILLLSSILVGGFLNILVCIAVASIVAYG